MKEKIKQLEYLHPKVIARAFYIHSGEDLKDQLERIKVVQKEIGDKLATYVMALLVLPQLMERAMKSDDYTEWTKNYRTRTIN